MMSFYDGDVHNSMNSLKVLNFQIKVCYFKKCIGIYCFLISKRQQKKQLFRNCVVLVHSYFFHWNRNLSFKLFSQQASWVKGSCVCYWLLWNSWAVTLMRTLQGITEFCSYLCFYGYLFICLVNSEVTASVLIILVL